MTNVALTDTAAAGLEFVSNKTAEELSYRASVEAKPLIRETERLQYNLSEFRLSGPSCESPKPNLMSVCGLNHFNITASRALIEQVKHFYTAVIGLKLGPRAQLANDGYWLYAGRMPIVHLSVQPGMATSLKMPKGYFNHISLSCVGLERAIAKMNATQTPYRLIQLPDIHQTQIFVTDPAGIGVELTFSNESLPKMR